MPNRILTLAAAACLGACAALACTSMIVDAAHSATGRPMIWKHRDTGAKGNFIERVPAEGASIGYVALFNDGDSLLREAWMGMNDAGFAILNTASYNVRPYYKNEDGEGLLMSMALAKCRTVEDFDSLLSALTAKAPSDIGINANFGVMDAHGGLAYFEADDYGYKRFDTGRKGYLIRTNYSESGTNGKGMGHVRYYNAQRLLEPLARKREISPISFTETASRSFYQSKRNKDFAADGQGLIPLDNDYIPRSISTASIVIEGAAPGQDPSQTRMWAMLGYPPTSSVQLVTLDSIPADLRPLEPGCESKACNEANALRDSATVERNGKKSLDLSTLTPIMAAKHRISELEYRKHRLATRPSLGSNKQKQPAE